MFIVFALILLLHAAINIYSSHMVALFNNVSVWWHVGGVAVIIAILIFGPERHASADFVFTDTINNSGFGGGAMFWFYVLPLGFLLTQYTITGLRRVGAHLRGDARRGGGRAEGRLALGVLLGADRLGRAAGDHVRRHRRGRDHRRRAAARSRSSIARCLRRRRRS